MEEKWKQEKNRGEKKKKSMKKIVTTNVMPVGPTGTPNARANSSEVVLVEYS